MCARKLLCIVFLLSKSTLPNNNTFLINLPQDSEKNFFHTSNSRIRHKKYREKRSKKKSIFSVRIHINEICYDKIEINYGRVVITSVKQNVRG